MNEKEIGTATPSRVRTRRRRAARRLRPKPHRAPGRGFGPSRPFSFAIAVAALALSLLGLLAERAASSGRAAAANCHRLEAARQRDGGMERFHRTVRAAGIGRGARAGQRLSRIRQFHRRSARREGRPSLRHRAASLRARSRDGQGRAIAGRGAAATARPNSNAPRNLKNSYATKETYDERVAQVAIAQSTRDAAIAVNQAKLNLDYTRVTAPVRPHGTP